MLLFFLIGVAFFVYMFLLAPRFTKRKQINAFRGTSFAHRGLHDHNRTVPENSMAAFRAAIQKGVGIELDIHLTADHEIVVFHDDTLDRMCGVSGTIEEKTWAELQGLRLKKTQEGIPLFSDVLKEINGQVPLLVELKLPTDNASLCRHVFSYLSAYEGDFLVQSFNSLALFWFRRHAPSFLRGQLSSNLTADALKEPYALRWLVRFLLSNVIGRPDFISYKLKDSHNLSVFVLHKLLRTPTAVWTIRSKQQLLYAQKHYDMFIFEKED